MDVYDRRVCIRGKVFLKNLKFVGFDLAEKYRHDDLKIMASGETLRSKLELVGDGRGNVKWFITVKGPLRNSEGQIVGVEGLTRDVSLTKETIEPYSEFRKCIEYLQAHFTESVSIQYLAQESGMSMSTFERKFKKHFGSTPTRYIRKLRLEKATEMLQLGSSIQQTALDCGFCDQSYFTKEFRREMGMTPKAYLKSCEAKRRQ